MPYVWRLFAVFFAIISILPATAWGFDISDRVTEYNLENGMKWLFVRRTQAPVFSGDVMVKVGGVDEKEGKTGLAHMFEHMAFKGGKRLGTMDFEKEKPILDAIEKVGQELADENLKARPDPSVVSNLTKKLGELQIEADRHQKKNEIWEIMQRNGAADLNAYTSKDVTSYHASMPSNKLKLWALVMAEMVFDPVYREFYIERKVVAEERRSNLDNNPDGVLDEKFVSTAFVDGPFHWSTIGFEKDILDLTIGDARAFHKKYYVPNNMVGVLVGNFKISDAKRIVEETFGSYPRGENPPDVVQGKTRRGVLTKFKFDAEPSLAIAYHKPTLPDPAEYVFDVINGLLCEGRSSRLHKLLIYEKRLAESVMCSDGYPGSRLSNLFFIWIQPLKSVSLDAILAEVRTEVGRLSREKVDEAELKRVRKSVTASLIFALDKNVDFAEQLATFQTIFGDWRLLTGYADNISKVSADDVMDIAKRHLKTGDQVVVERVRHK